MTEQLKEIAIRLKTLRQIMDVSEEELAEVCGVNLEEYRAYERGEKDFSFSFIYNAANRLGVDVVDLMSGDSPKLSNMCVVRKGKGFKINRRKAYDYQHIAYTFRNKKVEPFVVTVEPKPEEEVPVLHEHRGPGAELRHRGQHGVLPRVLHDRAQRRRQRILQFRHPARHARPERRARAVPRRGHGRAPTGKRISPPQFTGKMETKE